MYSEQLKMDIRERTLRYAQARELPVDTQYKTAIIFQSIQHNFLPESFAKIDANDAWRERTSKGHTQVLGIAEMQSSNSSDALLMNVFCHPKISSWKKPAELMGGPLDNLAFGCSPRVELAGGRTDSTEIDLAFGNTYVEAKLTEDDFTQKDAAIVKSYVQLEEQFHVKHLAMIENAYDNYQLIRNLLASAQNDRNHILLCDFRRPDLAQRYMATVSCLRDPAMRVRCRVVYWQDLCAGVGDDLAGFLRDKYGIG